MALGFNSLNEEIALENIKFTGCRQNENGVRGNIDITIKNSSSISVLVDDLPVEICYKGVKVTIQAVFRLALPLTHNQIAEFTVPGVSTTFPLL